MSEPALTFSGQGGRLAGVAALERVGRGEAVLFEGVDIIHARIGRKTVNFCTDMRNDPVQRNHRQGQFYAMSDLRALRKAVRPGGVFADFGANTGNHSLFAALYMNARRVIPVEPNPRAYRLLMANVLVNGLAAKFDLSHLGIGVGARAGTGFGMEDRSANLGAAKMVPGAGDLTIAPGDDILAGVSPDVIKIDVETMEMEVLAGLEETVRRCRPVLFVEVEATNDEEFCSWAAARHYAVTLAGRQYQTAKNYLLQPQRA